jgi:hypothetical protein
MCQLESLARIDISLNQFHEIYSDVVSGLKEMPALRHLVIDIENEKQENMLWRELPELDTLNSKAREKDSDDDDNDFEGQGNDP